MSNDLKKYLKERLLEAGASAVGFTRAEPVDKSWDDKFDKWLQSGCAGQLEYMSRYRNIRSDPRLLLEGAKTIVSVAWNYLPSQLREQDLPFVARYAYGRDYHKALRSIMRPICRDMERLYSTGWRICIDSAPVAERYWAVKSGVGFIGRNGCLIVPKVGSWVFLSEIVLTSECESDHPVADNCKGCGACLSMCPGGALRDDNTLDVRCCLSAATVEGVDFVGNKPLSGHLLGCDRCQEMCPHNTSALPSRWMKPIEGIMKLDEREFEVLTDVSFRKRFAGTSFLRPGLKNLLKNLQLKH